MHSLALFPHTIFSCLTCVDSVRLTHDSDILSYLLAFFNRALVAQSKPSTTPRVLASGATQIADVFGPLLFERKQVLSARPYPNTHIQELFCPSCLLLCVFVVFFFLAVVRDVLLLGSLTLLLSLRSLLYMSCVSCVCVCNFHSMAHVSCLYFRARPAPASPER